MKTVQGWIVYKLTGQHNYSYGTARFIWFFLIVMGGSTYKALYWMFQYYSTSRP